MKKITQLIHNPYQAPSGFKAVMPAIYKASSVIFDNTSQLKERNWHNGNCYSYGLHGTPTTFTLQQRIASLEGGKYCLLAPSGLAAIGLINLTFLQSGAHVLLPTNVYGPNTDMIRHILGEKGVEYGFYDPMRLEDLQQNIKPNTQMLWLEAAGSVTLEFPNLVEIIQICKQHDILTVLDNTWGAGIAFNPFVLPGNIHANQPQTISVDISMQALTKYPSGGGDVLMGSITTNSAYLHKQLKATQQYMGINVAADDAESILKMLPSIYMRYQYQDEAARRIVNFLTQQQAIVKVLHVSLSTHTGHSNWKQVCVNQQNSVGSAAGILSFILEPHLTYKHAQQLCDQLKLFKIAYSWGGPISLCMPYNLTQLRPNNEVDSLAQKFGGNALVRLSIGFEDAQDLINDLQQALSILTKNVH